VEVNRKRSAGCEMLDDRTCVIGRRIIADDQLIGHAMLVEVALKLLAKKP
jgi:hypothetical protein